MSTAMAPATQEPFGGMAYVRKFTVDEYHALIRDGHLGEEDPVELLEGHLVLKMPRGPKHDFAVMALTRRLVRTLPDGWQVGPRTAATLPDSEPEPDAAVFRGTEEEFVARHPGPADIALLIEVSDSSLGRDTRDKARIYARAEVPVYWIVNVPDRRIEVLTDPAGPADSPAYRQRQEYPVGTTVPVVLDGTEVGTIPVAEVLR